MKLSVHLTFAGDCADAFRFYERVLGGRDLRLFRWGDAPGAGDMPADAIAHASLTLGAYELMGADVPAERRHQPAGFFVYYAADAQADAERIFAALADGGHVLMPLAKTYWSPCFGVVVDRFGTPWEITLSG